MNEPSAKCKTLEPPLIDKLQSSAGPSQGGHIPPASGSGPSAVEPCHGFRGLGCCRMVIVMCRFMAKGPCHDSTAKG